MILRLLNYLRGLTPGRTLLWCYLAWYLTTVALNFDASPMLWLNSLGISAIIGCGLLLSVGQAPRANPWQTFRLFLMPFCVSSFAALIKGKGYVLIFPTDRAMLLRHGLVCAGVVAIVTLARRIPSRGV